MLMPLVDSHRLNGSVCICVHTKPEPFKRALKIDEMNKPKVKKNASETKIKERQF